MNKTHIIFILAVLAVLVTCVVLFRTEGIGSKIIPFGGGQGSQNELNQSLATSEEALSSKAGSREGGFASRYDELSFLLKDQKQDKEELEEILFSLLESDERRAITYLARIDFEADFSVINDVLYTHFEKKNDWESALQAFDVLTVSPDIATHLLPRCLVAWSESGADKSIQWLMDHVDYEGVEHSASALGVFAANSERPSEYLSFLLKQDAPAKIVEPYIATLIEKWVKIDLAEAGNVLNALPPGRFADRAVYEFINNAKIVSPSNAMGWAESIKDAGLRGAAVVEIANAWHAKNREEYAEWRAQHAHIAELVEYRDDLPPVE